MARKDFQSPSFLTFILYNRYKGHNLYIRRLNVTMSDFQGFPPRPNLTGYTAVPNVFFDEVLPKINNMSELKILLAVFRKTYGWVKEIDPNTGQPIYKLEDEISYSQFEQLTGLSSTSVATGLTRAQNDGYLEKVQQGNFNGVTSAYRVITDDGSHRLPPRPQPTPKATTPIPQSPRKEGSPIQYLHVDDGDIEIPKRFGTSIADIMGEKQKKNEVEKTYNQDLSTEKNDILGEIFGSKAAKTIEPKKQKEKTITPHQEFIKNWIRCYYSTLNVPYGNINGKEHGHIKSLVKDFDSPILIKAMEFYFKNYQNLEGVPSDYPSITIFYSWRKKIIPSSQMGVVKPKTTQEKPSRNAREFDEQKFNESGGDFFANRRRR